MKQMRKQQGMVSWTRGAHLGILAALLTTTGVTASADEGMWLFTAPPRKLLQERYGFNPSAAWLDHVQKSAVRFNSGGSGSFVSEDGLIISNHHVGADALQKFGDEKHNFLRDGFYARALAEEKPCLDLELNVLMSIEDVTDRVNGAVKPGLSADEAFAARRAAIAAIEKESSEKTGLRSDVVTLYQGAQYHLYRYKRYTDVRLVFAPEQQIAFYGGDPDNFEYPRYDLDICLFRAYENGQPAKVQNYLKWSLPGVAENELVFVAGHPGNTDRLFTMAELEYLRDQSFPYTLERLNRLEVMLIAYSARSQENARQAKQMLFGVQNGRKARQGTEAGLLDPSLMAQKAAAEKNLREEISKRPDLKDTLAAWDNIRQAQQVIASNQLDYALLEGANGFNSTLFRIARTLLRATEEKAKPNGQRLREFRESNLPSLELGLFSEEPIYTGFEEEKLAHSLTWLAEQLGATNQMVQQVLAGKSPRKRAVELVTGTQVKEVAFRKKLYAGSAGDLQKIQDPMIELARLIDPESRRVRKIVEIQDEVKRQAHAQIGRAMFAIQKGESYPDATFTLRLAFGPVKGYTEDHKQIPYQTTFAGLYQRAAEHQNQPPFDLPQRWQDRKRRLNLSTPFNFVSTADIIGGNSGSPVINRQAEFVGIIFDGNIYSLVLDFMYTEEQARAVSVNSQAIIEALRKVYNAGALADELVNSKRKS